MTLSPGRGAPCLLYLISPPAIADMRAFAEDLDAALSVGGVGAFQLRLKREENTRRTSPADVSPLTLPAAEDGVILDAAEVLLPICRKHGVAFLINDSPRLAAEAGADGAHLGQEDGSVATARKTLGEDAVIGVSCHASKHLAMEAGEQGADYVAFGAFFPTASKSEAARTHWGTPTPELLAWWSAWTTVPCVAIGGVTPENCAPLVRAGADFLAALSAIWNYPQGPAAAVRDFHAAITEARRKEP